MIRLLTIGVVMFSGCIGTKSVPGVPYGYPPVPPEPEWVEYSRTPVVEKNETDAGTNYTVSDEFIRNHLLHVEYINILREWKQEHILP